MPFLSAMFVGGVSILAFSSLTLFADPTKGVDLANSPTRATVSNDNPLGPAPDKTSSDDPFLFGNDGSSHPTLESSDATKALDSNTSSDVVNGNTLAPQGMLIRRAKKVPIEPTDALPVQSAPKQKDVDSFGTDNPLGLTDSAKSPLPASLPLQNEDAEVETTPSVTPAPSLAMKLRLNDLIALQKAAEQAHGTLQIAISTVGINPEDLILPLRKQGFFNVTVSKDSFVVKSKDDALGEIDALTARRRELLQQISSLENEISTKRQDLSGSFGESRSASLPAPSSAPAAPMGIMSQSAPAELILTSH